MLAVDTVELVLTNHSDAALGYNLGQDRPLGGSDVVLISNEFRIRR